MNRALPLVMTAAALLLFSLPTPAQPVAASKSRREVTELCCTVVLGASSKKERVLHFPGDYSLGEISIITWPPVLQLKEWRGAARGTVIAPAGKMVRFIPAHRFYKNPEIVKTLPPDCIDSIVLSACKTLYSLNLEDNPMVTDRSVKALASITTLRVLNLGGTAITIKGVLRLKALPLVALQLPVQAITPPQLLEIKKAFPHALIAPWPGGRVSLDSETGTIFAPLH